jgi:hypothetical protein
MKNHSVPFSRFLFLSLFFAQALLAEGPVLPQELQDAMDKTYKRGRMEMDRWKDSVSDELVREFDRLNIREIGNKKAPFIFRRKKKLIANLQEKIGEGHNVEAWLTDQGTVMKIAKNPGAAKSNLMVAWLQPYMEEYGMKHARIHRVHPLGLWTEQELVPSRALDFLFSHSKEGVPEGVKEEVWEEWKKAEKLASEKGIWLDLKAANFAMTPDGKVVNVDFGPCLSGQYDRYFRSRSGRKLDKEEALENFFYRQVRKGSNFGKPADPDGGRKLWAKILERDPALQVREEFLNAEKAERDAREAEAKRMAREKREEEDRIWQQMLEEEAREEAAKEKTRKEEAQRRREALKKLKNNFEPADDEKYEKAFDKSTGPGWIGYFCKGVLRVIGINNSSEK